VAYKIGGTAVTVPRSALTAGAQIVCEVKNSPA